MKKWIIIILIIILIIFGLYFYKTHYNSEPNQICSKNKGYCVYNNIPDGMKYSEPPYWIKEDPSQPPPLDEKSILEFEDVWENLIKEGLITKEDVPPRVNYSEKQEYLGEDWNTCFNTGRPPIIIKYFYDLCENIEFGDVGCGHERRAIVCGDIYFVEDLTSSYGSKLYGPFNLP